MAVCAALEEVECTDEALTEALFADMPGGEISDITAAAVAEALRRSGTLMESSIALDRSRGFIYDSMKRRRRTRFNAAWVAYGARRRRRRLLAGWSLTELCRHINLSATNLWYIEQERGTIKPSALTLPKLAVALSTSCPQGTGMEP